MSNRIYRAKNGHYRNWRRAVGSHHIRGQYTLSGYVAGEAYMTADERKKTELPCGYTVAETWAGIRKAWLGFIIANSNGDFDRKVMYAKIIRKLKDELRISQTIFDIEIDDEDPDRDMTRCVYEKHNHDKDVDSCIYKDRNGFNNSNTPDKRSLDYDQMMQEARTSLKGTSGKPNPRQDIFDSHKKTFENPCNHTTQPIMDAKRPNFQRSTRTFEKNCRYVKPQKEPVAITSNIASHDQKNCRYVKPQKEPVAITSNIASHDQTEDENADSIYYVNPNYSTESYRRIEYERFRNPEDEPHEKPRSAKRRFRRLSCFYKRNES